jgi:Zn-dependent protease
VLDEDFVRGGMHEPPARARSAGPYPLPPRRLPVRRRPWGTGASWGSGLGRRWRPARSRPGWSCLRAVRPGVGRSSPDRRRRPGASGTPFGVSGVFVALLAATAGTAFAAWSEPASRPAVFGFVVTGWLVSLCLHEFAHASVAYAGGDKSTAVRGYLTFDIRRYVHPALTFLLPVLLLLIGGIGLPGGAVWIDQGALPSRGWRSAVSLAGPAANLVCAAACLVPFLVSGGDALAFGPHQGFWAAVAFLGLLQLWAVLLNLLPVPGLDGWGALEPWLPARAVAAGRRIAPFGFFILFLLVIDVPSAAHELLLPLYRAQDIFGVPRGLPALGYSLFRFWS